MSKLEKHMWLALFGLLITAASVVFGFSSNSASAAPDEWTRACAELGGRVVPHTLRGRAASFRCDLTRRE